MDGFYWRWAEVALTERLPSGVVIGERQGREIEVALYRDGPWRLPDRSEKRLLGFRKIGGMLTLPPDSALFLSEGGFLGVDYG